MNTCWPDRGFVCVVRMFKTGREADGWQRVSGGYDIHFLDAQMHTEAGSGWCHPGTALHIGLQGSTAFGAAGDDELYGSMGADMLFGGDGDDLP